MTAPLRDTHPLRIVHLAAHDGRGGAARAMRRLHRGLREAGAHSRVVVRERFHEDPDVLRFDPERGPRPLASELRLADRAWTPDHERFSDDRTEIGARLLGQLPPADLYNLHWVGGLLDWRVLPRLAERAPIVWTLSDMNPFTGGCHYDLGCGAFRRSCDACPQHADSPSPARGIFARKLAALARVPAGRLHFVAGSRWLARRLGESALCADRPVTVLPRGVDTERFRPCARASVRRALGFEAAERVALFVSTHLHTHRKGLVHALAATSAAASRIPGLRLVCAGRGAVPGGQPIPVRALGHVASDARMAELLGAADVVLVPSLQEAFGLTALEALACGTPVVAYATGGAPDLIEPGVHGALAAVGDTQGLARGLVAVLDDEGARRRMGRAARRMVEERFDLAQQAERYLALYRELVAAGVR